MKKTLSLLLVLAALLSLPLGVVSFAEDAGELDVAHANLEFASSIHIWFAVDYSAIGNADGITLKVTNNATGEVTTLSPNLNISTPEGCIGFKYTKLKFKNMGDELTLQAYRNGEPSGKAKTYSTLEYALKAQVQSDENLGELMRSMLLVGKNAQKAFDHAGTYDLSKSYSLVNLDGGAVVNGKEKAIVTLGSALTATKEGADDSYVWYNGDNEEIGRGPSVSFTADAPFLTVSCAPASTDNQS